MRRSMVDIQPATAEIRRGKKEGRKKPQDKNKMVPILCRAALIINIHKEKLTKFTYAVNRVLHTTVPRSVMR